jgi:phospholipid transport system transporter-binding protein
VINLEGNRLMLSGSLVMSTVPALYEAGLKQLSDADMEVDMAKVEVVDSAALSMLFGWLRAAQSKNRSLRVKNVPANLLSLANLYGVAGMLPQ